MYKNYAEAKKNINSLKWGREEKVTDKISRRRLLNDGAKGYSYKYYMNSDPNTYVVMSSGKPPYIANNITADATAFGVRNGVATKTVDYLNDNYIYQDNYFRDATFDKIGNVAVKDFKLKGERKKNRKSEAFQKYNKVLDKEFIEKLKPELEKAAQKRGATLRNFEISVRTGGIFPSMQFYLDSVPVTIETNLNTYGKHEKYFGYLRVGEPKNNKTLQLYSKMDKITQELTKIVNDTCKERTRSLMKDPDGRNLRINKKAQNEKEGMSAKKGSTLRLQYEEYEPNYFPY